MMNPVADEILNDALWIATNGEKQELVLFDQLLLDR